MSTGSENSILFRNYVFTACVHRCDTPRGFSTTCACAEVWRLDPSCGAPANTQGQQRRLVLWHQILRFEPPALMTNHLAEEDEHPGIEITASIGQFIEVRGFA